MITLHDHQCPFVVIVLVREVSKLVCGKLPLDIEDQLDLPRNRFLRQISTRGCKALDHVKDEFL